MIIERVESVQRLAALRDAWSDLLQESVATSPFLTWEWTDAWWRSFGAGRHLRVFAGWSGGRLDLLAPLMARRRQISRGMLSDGLEPIGTGSVGADYLDVVIRRGQEPHALDALATRLSADSCPVIVPRADAEASNLRELAARLLDAGWRVRTRAREASPYITLAGHTWETFVSSLGREHRANLRRRTRKLHDTFAVHLLRAHSDEQRERYLDALIRLHAMRWSGRGGSTAFHTRELVAFHHDFTRRALEQGWLRLFLLTLDESPAAALYGLRFGETFYFYQSGFDPRYTRDAVGLVLLGAAIEQAIGEGAAEFDLLHGREPYKFLWASQSRTLDDYEIYPPTPAGRAAHRLTEIARRARHVAHVALRTSGH